VLSAFRQASALAVPAASAGSGVRGWGRDGLILAPGGTGVREGSAPRMARRVSPRLPGDPGPPQGRGHARLPTAPAECPPPSTPLVRPRSQAIRTWPPGFLTASGRSEHGSSGSADHRPGSQKVDSRTLMVTRPPSLGARRPCDPKIMTMRSPAGTPAAPPGDSKVDARKLGHDQGFGRAPSPSSTALFPGEREARGEGARCQRISDGDRRESGRTARGADAEGPARSRCRWAFASRCGCGCAPARRCRARCPADGRTRRG
jgi:hypothetical protein